jgi:hypothetical protein
MNIAGYGFRQGQPDGMIRCYKGTDKVVGFGHQFVKAPPPEGPDSEAARPGPRIIHPASASAFQALRTEMESEWNASDDAIARYRRRVAADHLGRGLSANSYRRRHLCTLRDQCQLGVLEQAPSEIAGRASDRLLSPERTRDTKNG